MTVMLNGEPREVSDGVTVGQMLRELGFAGSAVAVAINTAFVPRSEHATHQLEQGDKVELLAPMQGG